MEAEESPLVIRSSQASAQVSDRLLVDFTGFDYDPLAYQDKSDVSACVTPAGGTRTCTSRSGEYFKNGWYGYANGKFVVSVDRNAL